MACENSGTCDHSQIYTAYIYSPNFRVDSPEKLQSLLPKLSNEIVNDPISFKKMYLFAFGFAKTTSQKSMDIDVSHRTECESVFF